jgi:hypothetical protein
MNLEEGNKYKGKEKNEVERKEKGITGRREGDAEDGVRKEGE